MVCIRPSKMALVPSADVVGSCSSCSNNSQNQEENLVLCGKRGKANSKNPGNVKFTMIIRANTDGYVRVHTRTEKAIFVASVVSYLLHEVGLKFMNYDKATGQFKELSTERVHDKVSHAIRDQIRQNAKEQEESSSSSSSSSSSKAPASSRKGKPAIKKKADVGRNSPQVPDVTKSLAAEGGNSFCDSSTTEHHHMLMTITPSLFLNDLLFDLGGVKVEETRVGGNTSNEILSMLEDELLDDDDDMIVTKSSLLDNDDLSSSSSTPLVPDACVSASNTSSTTIAKAAASSSPPPYLPLPFDTQTEFESQDIEFLKVVLSTGETK